MGTFTKEATDDTFDSMVLQSSEPVLVDFWAPWCSPCLAIGPSLEKLAEEFEGKASVVKVNVDENPQVAARFGVRSIPFLVMFKSGEVSQSAVGAQAPQSLKKMIEEAL